MVHCVSLHVTYYKELEVPKQPLLPPKGPVSKKSLSRTLAFSSGDLGLVELMAALDQGTLKADFETALML